MLVLLSSLVIFQMFQNSSDGIFQMPSDVVGTVSRFLMQTGVLGSPLLCTLTVCCLNVMIMKDTSSETPESCSSTFKTMLDLVIKVDIGKEMTSKI